MDAGTTMVLVGATLQALPPASALIEQFRQRPNAAELQRTLSQTPVARPDRTLDQLLDQASAAIDRLD